MNRLWLFIYLFVTVFGFAQSNKSDSLISLLLKANNDTTKINLYNALSFGNINSDPDTAIYFANKALLLAHNVDFKVGELEAQLYLGKAYLNIGENNKSINSLKQGLINATTNKLRSKRVTKDVADIHNSLGNTFFTLSNSDLALQHYSIALKLREAIDDTKGVIASYNNIGLIFYVKGNYKKALQNYFISLKKAEQANDEKGMLLSYNNIGKVYIDQQQLDNAYAYFKKALDKSQKLDNPNFTATASYNVADILLTKKDYTGALSNANNSYNIGKKTNNNSNMSNALDLMGQAYLMLGNYPLALQKEFEALKLSQESENKINEIGVLSSISKIYLKQKNYNNAILYGNKALRLSQEIESLTSQQIASNILAECYAATAQYQSAYEMKSKTLEMNDSLINSQNQRELLRQSILYDYEKQALADSLKYDSNKKIIALENQTRLKTAQTKLILVIVGLVIATIVGLVLFQRFKQSQKQKDIIEFQKQSLEQKTKEIQDSILYSKEIQNTFLKSIVNNHKNFKDALLIYKPKDVVSGDFYWYKEIGDNLFVVVGDCTGHGVPGAIITVLAIQSLEKIIAQITDLEKFHELNNLLKGEFNVYYDKDNHVSIGLDYSIICLNKKSATLYLTGSGCTILLKDKSNAIISESFESINIGGSVPVKYNPRTVRFAFTEIRSVFLYTDGVVDQRGGENNKKFGTKQLKSVLENLNTKNTTDTHFKIETTLNDWKGENKQMDDITLLGLQINV